jgi:hypothetical protein
MQLMIGYLSQRQTDADNEATARLPSMPGPIGA